MKLFKWMILFVVAFLLAWVLIFTFTQTPFKETASARILTWWAPPLPIYIYVAGAFGIGLLVGLFTTLYYYIVLQAKVHRKTRELRGLEEKLVEARRALQQVDQTSAMVHEMSAVAPLSDATLSTGGETNSSELAGDRE